MNRAQATQQEAELAAAETELARLGAERDLWRVARQDVLRETKRANNAYIQACLAIEPMRRAVEATKVDKPSRRRRSVLDPLRVAVDELGFIK